MLLYNDYSRRLTVSDLTVELTSKKAFSIVNEAVPMLTDMAIKRLKPKEKLYNVADRDGK